MILSAEQSLRAIHKILGNELLPMLEKASWAASNVRTCLTLLTYAEDCVRLERSLLLETNGAMRALFEGLADAPPPAWLPGALHAAVALVVRSAPLPGTAGTADLMAENERYKALLADLVQQAAAARQAAPGSGAAFRAELHRCLAVLAAKDAELTERSRSMLPL